MASYQAKIGWKMLRKRENKIMFPLRSYLTGQRKFQKKARKFKKLKNIPLWLVFKPKQDGKRRERENKNYRSVSLLPDA